MFPQSPTCISVRLETELKIKPLLEKSWGEKCQFIQKVMLVIFTRVSVSLIVPIVE